MEGKRLVKRRTRSGYLMWKMTGFVVKTGASSVERRASSPVRREALGVNRGRRPPRQGPIGNPLWLFLLWNLHPCVGGPN